MWQMLRWFLQWLNKFFRHLFGSSQINDNAVNDDKVVKPPELTNSDLELLYTQLLEGVHQARGQQWALNYLQRVEHRISEERWLDWLLMYGDRLLTSPVPNQQLAVRMVRLGELDIGKIGELSYEIGMRLLQPDLTADAENDHIQEAIEFTAPIDPLDTPGQRLLRDLGEQLWIYEEEVTPISPAPQIYGESSNYGYAEDPSEDLSYEEAGQVSPLASVERNTYTVEELTAKLEESTKLVRQLAAELAQGNRQSAITPVVYNQAEVWFYQGLQQAKTGDLSGALAYYSQAIKAQPNAYEYWFNQGLILFHLQRFEEAIAAYDQAIKLKFSFYPAWYHWGVILGELGDFQGAIACFERVIEFKPNHADAWSSRGLALLKLGLIWEAISSYDQAIELQPEDPQNWYYRGVALGVIEQFEDAISSYDQALAIQPDLHEVWIDRGVVLFSLKRWSEAIASWDQALTYQPELYLAWFNRAIALDNLGKREEAIQSYRQAIVIKPDFHLAWYNQAVALFYVQRYAEAINCYDNALEMKLDYWEAWIGRGAAVGSFIHNEETLSVVSRIAAANPALNQRGYEGKLASYEEGLKHLRPDTHPEGWGRLQIAAANTHFEQGKKQPSPRNYWQKAAFSYQEALLTITSEDFPELHLEILQSLSKVLICLGQNTSAQELQQQGIYLLQQILEQPTRSDENKKQLALKFAGLGQLAVDLAVEAGDLVEAWEIAENWRNHCLHWQLFGWSDRPHTTNYSSIQQLLNPNTAIIYWHISPAALHTLIIKDQAPSPILLFTPIQDQAAIPEGVRRLIEFEIWLENWHSQQQEYCQQNDAETKVHHPRKEELQQRLLQLKNILNISTIIPELEGISHLILIPHRDLSKIPLHALFHLTDAPNIAVNYTITYLPSIQIGTSLNKPALIDWQQQKLLLVENNLKSEQLSAEIISQIFSQHQRIPGIKANKENIINLLLADYNILHFSVQAINNSSDLQNTQIILAGGEKITLPEISQHQLGNYHLIALSACENVTHSHSEYLGLETGFLIAGVPYIVSTIWQVESSANDLVMIEFYRRLSNNKLPATALAEATTWLREVTAAELTKWYEDLLNHLPLENLKIRNYLTTQLNKTNQLPPEQKPYNHPYYWAAFSLTGLSN
jgi:tetratricopeptide (TPR) repeat protein/CHAT domain-containing protein